MASSSNSNAHLYAYMPDGTYIGEVQNGGGSRYADIAHFLRLPFDDDATAAASLTCAVRDLLGQLGQPTSVKEMGISAAAHEAVIGRLGLGAVADRPAGAPVNGPAGKDGAPAKGPAGSDGVATMGAAGVGSGRVRCIGTER